MIQRIQTLWLLLATGITVLIWLLPVFGDDTGNLFLTIDASLFLMLSVISSGLVSFATIFLFKKRGTQKQLIVLNFCLAISIILLEYFEVMNFKATMGILQGHWQLSAILPFFIITFLVFAYRGIRKDEKLLDSTDRLR
jgi:hypothetical protein